MLADSLTLINQSTAKDFAVDSGAALPTNMNTTGELFYLAGVGLHVFSGTSWLPIAGATKTGAALPGAGSVGELFYKTGAGAGLFVWNGSAWSPVGAGTTPYDIALQTAGAITATTPILSFVIGRPASFASGWAGSLAKAQAAGNAATVLTIAKNGTSIGTITYGSGSTTGTFAGTAGNFVAGDLLTVTTPSVVASGLLGLSITLVGSTT